MIIFFVQEPFFSTISGWNFLGDRNCWPKFDNVNNICKVTVVYKIAFLYIELFEKEKTGGVIEDANKMPYLYFLM